MYHCCKSVAEMWDKPTQVDLPTEEQDLEFKEKEHEALKEVPEDDKLAFSEEFFNKYCDLKIKE